MAYIRKKLIGKKVKKAYYYITKVEKDKKGKFKEKHVAYVGDLNALIKLNKSINREIKKSC